MKNIMENFRKNVINEAKGSTAGEGMPLERAFKYAMEYAVKKRLNLKYAQKVANKNMSDLDGQKAIEKAIDTKVAYR